MGKRLHFGAMLAQTTDEVPMAYLTVTPNRRTGTCSCKGLATAGMRRLPMPGLALAGNDGMEKNMETIIMGYIRTTIRIHPFIPFLTKGQMRGPFRSLLGARSPNCHAEVLDGNVFSQLFRDGEPKRKGISNIHPPTPALYSLLYGPRKKVSLIIGHHPKP